MRKFAILFTTAAFATAGICLGYPIHGWAAGMLLTTAAGALGGFGIAGAAWQVRDLMTAKRGRAAYGAGAASR